MKDYENETIKFKRVFKSYGKIYKMVFSLSFMREQNINA
jgi:hypothetical protein